MRRALVLAFLLPTAALADSPLTSISFASAYSDLPVLSRTAEERLAFLTRQDVPNDQKLAVANALGPDANGTVFVDLLDRLRPGDRTPSDLFVAGYLLAQDDYLELKVKRWGLTPLQMLDKAAAALPDDFAVHYARALVQAQGAMSTSWCQVFRIHEAVLKKFPPAKRNLKPGAVEAAHAYLSGYEESCEGSPAATLKQKEELNQIYTLSKLGRQVVAGTQGGVVVWNPDAPDKPVAVRPGFICSGVAFAGAVWTGCEGEVTRWDGKAFKSYLQRKQGKNTAAYYHPMLGRGGRLWVRLGAKTFAYDEASDRFLPEQAPWKGDVYDAIVRKGGDVMWIDFLRALVVNGRSVSLKSAEYPGSDPRRFREDERGMLWVEDFEMGLFRFDEATRRFVREPALADKGSGVVFDAARGRLIMLHYTRGLVVETPGQGQSKVDLTELGYMRDMLLDENGDVWVGGWGALARLRPDGPGFGRQSYVAK